MVLNVTPSPLALAALPGAMLPISNTPGSVAVCATESELCQFTDWPTLTITGLGENVPFLIVTVSRLGEFTHSGFDGEVELPAEPHPIAKRATRTTAPTVDRVAIETMFQRRATPVPSTELDTY